MTAMLVVRDLMMSLNNPQVVRVLFIQPRCEARGLGKSSAIVSCRPEGGGSVNKAHS